MPRYGLRDGRVTADRVLITGKIAVVDRWEDAVASSATGIVSSGLQGGTTAYTIAGQPDYPRVIKLTNAYTAAGGTANPHTVVGYDGQGNYISETLSAGTATAATAYSNNAFAYVGTIAPQASALSRGAYGTTNLGYTEKFGLTHPILSYRDIIGEKYGMRSTVGGFTARAGTTYVVNGLTVGSAFVGARYDTIDNLNGQSWALASSCELRYLTRFQKKNSSESG